jgi:VanZ family protein
MRLIHFCQVKIIKHLLERKFFWLALIWTFVITVASLVSVNSFSKIKSVGNDKIVHFLFYLFFVILWGLVKRQNDSNRKYYLFVFLVAMSYGLIIEVLQEILTNTRQADFYDFLANTMGAFVGLIVLLYYKNKFF